MTTCTRHFHVKYFVNVTDPGELVVQLIAWLDKICFYRIIQQKKTVSLMSSNDIKTFCASQEWKILLLWPEKFQPVFVQLEKGTLYLTLLKAQP